MQAGTSSSGRRRAVVARGLTALALALAGGGALASVRTAGWGSLYLDEPVAGIVLALVGGLLASRVPGNPIGWIFLAGGLAGAGATVANAVLADAAPGAAAPSSVVAGLGGSLWTGPFLVIPVLLLLFPDGRLRSPGWRAAVIAVTGGGLAIVAVFFVGSLVATPSDPPPAAVMLAAVGTLLGGFAAGLAHLVLRYRASRGDERQQLRWFIAGGTATAVLVALAILVLQAEAPGSGAGLTLNEVVWALALLPIPLATGVAVLRYRLYDLGRLVSRTLSYGVVTAALVGVYSMLVTGLALLTPGSATSPLTVAASTLAAATLFRPLRSRVQRVVDRRFDRSRYDADRTSERFRAHVRGVVDLAEVTAGLVDAAGRSVQPTTVGVWLRPGSTPRRAPDAQRGDALR